VSLAVLKDLSDKKFSLINVNRVNPRVGSSIHVKLIINVIYNVIFFIFGTIFITYIYDN